MDGKQECKIRPQGQAAHSIWSLPATVLEIWPGQNLGGKKKNNEANWMVSNSAQLDSRTKQHPQFEVSASNGSRDMARTKSWGKKKEKRKKK